MVGLSYYFFKLKKVGIWLKSLDEIIDNPQIEFLSEDLK